MIVSWFSAGVSSAVATKMAIKTYGDIHIRYHHIDDQHSDTLRFVADCEKWFGLPIHIDQSPYKSVENACYGAAFMRGPHGAACTRLLKKRLGKLWQMDNPGRHTFVWGLDANEKDRVAGFLRAMPDHDHVFPLVDAGLRKKEIHGMLEAAGIKRPAMYDLGYHNNNCIGCIRGGMGYWNKIRVDFPEVFAARSAMEKKIGNHILKECYLDELDPNRGRHEDMILPDCGMFCEIEGARPAPKSAPENTSEARLTAYNSRVTQRAVAHIAEAATS
jgi:3'-phosphoadenosine 5'-phosphosulfate sulfotransferase (PAPS reductase)/FAD synthetase